MTELKLISRQSGSLQTLIEGVLADALRSTETGVGRTEARLRSFEEKYQLSTVEFLELVVGEVPKGLRCTFK